MPALGRAFFSYQERSEIYTIPFQRNMGLQGFATVAGDRHSFWAGFIGEVHSRRSPADPVGVAFVV